MKDECQLQPVLVSDYMYLKLGVIRDVVDSLEQRLPALGYEGTAIGIAQTLMKEEFPKGARVGRHNSAGAT